MWLTSNTWYWYHQEILGILILDENIGGMQQWIVVGHKSQTYLILPVWDAPKVEPIHLVSNLNMSLQKVFVRES